MLTEHHVEVTKHPLKFMLLIIQEISPAVEMTFEGVYGMQLSLISPAVEMMIEAFCILQPSLTW